MDSNEQLSGSVPRGSAGQVDPSRKGEPARGRSVDILDGTGRLTPSELSWIHAHAIKALEVLQVHGQLRVRMVDDPEMIAAHAEFLEDPTTTDVLTFDMSDDEGLDVDIMACVNEAERRSAELEHDRSRELLLYIVHGVLHCTGFDDHDEAERQRMHQREDEVLEAVGAGATFHRAARDGERLS